MNDAEIIELIRNNPDYNFFAVAVTPWHAHGIDVAIKRLASEGVMLKGIIFAIVHPGSPRCVGESNFVLSGAEIKVVEVDFEQKSWMQKLVFNIRAYMRLRKEKNKTYAHNIYVVRPSYPDFNWINYIRSVHKDKGIVFISVDEGCGSYIVGESANWVSAMMAVNTRKDKFKKMLMYFISLPRKVIRDLITNRLISYNAYHEWNLLKYDKDNHLVTDEKNAPFYKQVLQEQSFQINIETRKLYEGVVLVNTSPSYEEGKIQEDEDIRTLEVMTEILKDRGVPIVIKTHPRECAIQRYEHLPCSINTISGVSQETIISKLDVLPKSIVSINSTTLVTLNALYGIPAIGLTKICMAQSKNEVEKKALQNFVNAFCHIVQFPENEEELRECLNSILE